MMCLNTVKNLLIVSFLFFSLALSLEPYGLSLPVSVSSCALTERQSPTLLSLSSGLSGNSMEPALRTG